MTRVADMGVPEWFSELKSTDMKITLDNDLVLAVYEKQVKKGENVTLGKNGGNGNNVCCIALGVAEGASVFGDLNMDGKFNIADIVLLQKWILAVPDTTLPNWKAGDMNNDNTLNSFDLALMRKELVS